jgi:alpha,alpha-trehalase
MKRLATFLSLLFLLPAAWSQVVPTPDKIWGQLFKDVQLTRALGDNKTFVDMVPQHSPQVILSRYAQLKQKDSASIRSFVLSNFYMPATPEPKFTQGLSMQQHLNELWNTLTRTADKKLPHSSLLPLPKSYIVPGGRFREIYYWDSYFTMLGLGVSNRYDLVESMLDNFKHLIDTYGHIPNGNRNYYLGRSQPPFYALMVELLANQKGEAIYRKYYTALEKEYNFWMNGSEKLKPGQAFRRVVKLDDGSILNRHFDDVNAPRQESYAEDVHTAEQYLLPDSMVYTNLRAGAESGWDFSSRWFADTLHLNTIETTNIIPVDLNALLYAYENILAKATSEMGNKVKAGWYKEQAEKRQKAVLRYCWNADLQFFFDYDFKEMATTDKWSAAGAMPLFTNLATPHHAMFVEQALRNRFLKDGGIVTTLYHTGQQWDAPNGWPPLQYIAVKGLMNYGYKDLPKTIATRWMAINEKVFAATGKMMEKYNVENISLISGGGEYPTQDGFGWTNGVYLKFIEMFKSKTAF